MSTTQESLLLAAESIEHAMASLVPGRYLHSDYLRLRAALAQIARDIALAQAQESMTAHRVREIIHTELLANGNEG
jgi:hypothetical protein